MAAAVDLTSVAGRARAVDRLVPLFSQCREEVRRDLMLRRVAQRFEVDEQALRRDVAAALSRPRRARPAEPEEAPRPRTAGGAPKPATGSELERQFVGLLLQHPELIERSREHLASELFADADVRRLVDYLTGHPPEDGHVDLTALLNHVDEDLQRLVSTCAMESFDPGHVEELWSDHLHRLRRADLTRRLNDTKSRLQRAKEAGNADEEERLRAAPSESRRRRHSVGGAAHGPGVLTLPGGVGNFVRPGRTPRAHSSAGQSGGLIIRWSQVRTLVGPPGFHRRAISSVG